MKYRAGFNPPLPMLLLLTLLPLAGFAGVCEEVEQAQSFAENDRTEHAYFDQYFIRSEDGKHFILAIKYLDMEPRALARVLGDLERHAEFLPGYSKIQVKRIDDASALTAIRFKPEFAFFESRFTNRVELLATSADYRQCWQQLDDKDARVMEKFRNAPRRNRGYWRVGLHGDNGTELSYFSNIKPPIPIPAFIYRYAVTNSYREVFESVIKRARHIASGH